MNKDELEMELKDGVEHKMTFKELLDLDDDDEMAVWNGSYFTVGGDDEEEYNSLILF